MLSVRWEMILTTQSICLIVVPQPTVVHDLLIDDVSRSHTMTHHTQ